VLIDPVLRFIAVQIPTSASIDGVAATAVTDLTGSVVAESRVDPAGRGIELIQVN